MEEKGTSEMEDSPKPSETSYFAKICSQHPTWGFQHKQSEVYGDDPILANTRYMQARTNPCITYEQ